MKIWHISDTHTYHKELKVPTDVDTVIFSGDCSNYKDPFLNETEVLNFLEWFMHLPIENKVFVAGNHDTSIEKNLISEIDFIKRGIIYLENKSAWVDGVLIYGSPQTPTFGIGWAFNKDRSKLHKHWTNFINEDCDILVTHGPPKGILDYTLTRSNSIESAGDISLYKVVTAIQPRYHLFGHIHNCKGVVNAGIFRPQDQKTVFSNGSVVTDNKFGQGISNGNTFHIPSI